MRKSGDLQGAARTLSQLVLVAPDDPRVMAEYGKTLVAEGRSDDALAFLERAIELKPSDWALYSAQGIAYDQKENYKAAQIAYGRALAINPGEPTVLSNDALSHVQMGDLDGAERLLLQAPPNMAAIIPRIAQQSGAGEKPQRRQAPSGRGCRQDRRAGRIGAPRRGRSSGRGGSGGSGAECRRRVRRDNHEYAGGQRGAALALREPGGANYARAKPVPARPKL